MSESVKDNQFYKALHIGESWTAQKADENLVLAILVLAEEEAKSRQVQKDILKAMKKDPNHIKIND